MRHAEEDVGLVVALGFLGVTLGQAALGDAGLDELRSLGRIAAAQGLGAGLHERITGGGALRGGFVLRQRSLLGRRFLLGGIEQARIHVHVALLDEYLLRE